MSNFNFVYFNCQYSTKVAAFFATDFPIIPFACPAFYLITVPHLILAVRVPSLLRGVAPAQPTRLLATDFPIIHFACPAFYLITVAHLIFAVRGSLVTVR